MRSLLLAVGFLSTLVALSAAEVTIEFAPIYEVPPGTYELTNSYSEDGYNLKARYPERKYSDYAPQDSGGLGPRVVWPGLDRHGVSLVTGPALVTRDNEQSFNPKRIQIAEPFGSVIYSESGPAFYSAKTATIKFTGVRRDGTTVTASFTTDGVLRGIDDDYQDFVFPDTFRELVSLELSGNANYRDLVVIDPLLRFEADVSFDLVSRPEPAVTKTDTRIRSKPTTVSGEYHLRPQPVKSLVRQQGLITGKNADHWHLVCFYNAYLVDHTPGPLHFELVHKTGKRVNIDRYISLEMVAVNQHIDVARTDTTKPFTGELSEERFYKFKFTNPQTGYNYFTAYGNLTFAFKVEDFGGEEIGISSGAEGIFTGHSGLFAVLQGTVKIGEFKRVD